MATPGLRLEEGDALLTCESASATLRASARVSSALEWKQKDGSYVGALDAETLVVLQKDQPSPPVAVDVVQLRGKVLYSKDQPILRSLGFPRTMRSATPAEVLKDQSMRGAVNRLTWGRLKAGDRLYPWQMIWTDRGGRVEIEITQIGTEDVVDEATDVRGPDGQFTRKKRFPEETFFILHPRFYREAKVNKILGDVLVSIRSDQVELFLREYGTIMHSWRSENTATATKWRELLRKPELE